MLKAAVLEGGGGVGGATVGSLLVSWAEPSEGWNERAAECPFLGFGLLLGGEGRGWRKRSEARPGQQ